MNFELNEEQQLWKSIVHDFVAKEVKPRARHVDETGEFNWTAVRKMGAIGLLGLQIPEALGGAGVDAVSGVIAIEELGWGCGSTALAISAHNGLGCSPVVRFASEALQQKYLPKAASGDGRLAGTGRRAASGPVDRGRRRPRRARRGAGGGRGDRPPR